MKITAHRSQKNPKILAKARNLLYDELPDGIIDHREEGQCPKTGEKMVYAYIEGEAPQKVWFAPTSRVVMPVKTGEL